jgi:hypothetical protein
MWWMLPPSYSQIFTLERVRPSTVADGLAELQIRLPSIPIVFCGNRKLAEEWTYRYLAAAHTWAQTETAALQRIGLPTPAPANPASTDSPSPPVPTTAQIRAWALTNGLTVPRTGVDYAQRSTRPGTTPTPPDNAAPKTRPTSALNDLPTRPVHQPEHAHAHTQRSAIHHVSRPPKIGRSRGTCSRTLRSIDARSLLRVGIAC